MNVADTCKRMMLAWPSLYPTRIAALLHIFDSSEFGWSDGELVLVGHDHYSEPHKPECRAKLEENLAKADSDVMRDFAIDDLLNARRVDHDNRFVIDNADLLCRSDAGKILYAPRLRGLRLDDMPTDVSADWLDAAKSLCVAVLAFRNVPANVIAEENARRQRCTDESQLVAKQFLERFRVQPIDTYARIQREGELLREARALGLELKRPDGTDVTPAAAF